MKNWFISSIITSFLAAQALAGTTSVPAELETQVFADASMAPCPAVIAASPYGDVFVGVDMQGSLGTKPNLGYITKLVDINNDGKADKKTVFAKVDNPRGIISIGNKIIALHCTQKNGKIFTQQLSLFLDEDNDGVADGPAHPLIKGIGNSQILQKRGTDHSTNNIRLGIDGWIYISIGDFGFIDAEGTDGTKLSMHGGGVVRVRPDGSEMETFIHGTRNVYDVAIDPFMNIVTRENTNDGVGWWTRFSHYIQSGEYGYPSLYTNFAKDMLPALGEYGGGSGCGNIYFEEPGWPKKYNKTFMMSDWGRSEIYIHRVKKNGASFTNKPEKFISTTQVTDLDTDASGRMYIASWDGAGYKGSPNKGFISIVTPKGWKYMEFPDLTKVSSASLVYNLKTASSTARVYAQQEILRRNEPESLTLLEKISLDKSASDETRVAAIFTYNQLAYQLDKDMDQLIFTLAKDANSVVREQTIRVMTDRVKNAKEITPKMLDLLKKALKDSEPRVQVAAAIALGRTQKLDAVKELIALANPPAMKIIKVNNSLLDQAIEVKAGQEVQLDVDISTFKQLCLIVDGTGDNANDEVAWINPVVQQKFGKSTDMTKFKWKSATQDKGKTLVNKTAFGKHLPNKAKGIGTHANSVITFKLPSKAVTFTATGILTSPNGKGSAKFIVSSSPEDAKKSKQPMLHSTPNKEIILPHVATKALLALDAQDACISALLSGNEVMQRGALATMKFMHSENVVDALITAAEKNTELQPLIVRTLARLHQKEVEYDGSTWWTTRPDPAGPYYYPTDWSGTPKISSFINRHYESLDDDLKKTLVTELKKNKAYVPELNKRPEVGPEKKITVGNTSIEDLIIHVGKAKGKAKNGAKIINQVGCAGCHGIKNSDIVKGPDLTKLGHMSNEELTEAIVKPGATIAESWVSVTMKNGDSHVGTVVKKDANELTLHNIGGIATKLNVKDIVKTEPGLNMMSLHLCDNLTLKQFSDLLAYIKGMDKRKAK